MDYKEKYETALEGIREILDSGQDSIKMSRLQLRLQGIFPELNETDDEKIRKVISDILLIDSDEIREILDANNVLMQDIDAWLEKQGEKKSADKIQIGKEYKCIASPRYSTFMRGEIYKPEDKFLCSLMNFCSDCFEPIEDSEPKFKVGDWVVQEDIGVYKIIEVCKSWYEVVDNKDKHYSIGFDKEYMCHLWSIADAKDGDVLCYKNEISLYKHDIKNCTKEETTFGGFVYHCCYDGKRFIMDSLYSLIEQDKIDIHPAAKEQRDILEKAMADAGYAFDFEKKDLKKVEDKNPLLSDFFKAEYERGKADAQKPVEWSEEDERSFQIVIDILDRENHSGKLSTTDLIACVRKLKSLKPPSSLKLYRNCKIGKKDRISMTEIEIKLEIFKAIANNSQNLCDNNKYMPPTGVANWTNQVYDVLTKKNN